MTTVEIVFEYGKHPDESVLRAVNNVREVYGIRRILFHEAEHTVRIEYDATRLTAAAVHQLFRRAGLDLTREIPGATVPEPADEVAGASTPGAKA
jgi:hypothetical protein